ncbi:MAG: FGGY-family carbohydrate kinase [Candidatus Caldatribacteriaceae bacterium]
MSKMTFIGLDVGTTRCKAALFDEKGKLIRSAFREYGYTTPFHSWAEQDPEEVWQCVQETLREVTRGGNEKPAALSVSAQGEAVIFLDKDGKILRPAILGMDMRAREESQDLQSHFGAEELLDLSGVPVHPLTSATKILWVRNHEPDIFEKVSKIFCYEDFMLWKLGSLLAIDYSMASKTLLFDRRKKTWSQEVLSYIGIEVSQLASCYPSGVVVGTIREEIAKDLGLPSDLKLVTGGHDQCCAALGSGAVTGDIAFDNVGTAEVFGVVVDEQEGDVVLRIHPQNFSCYNHVLPRKLLLATLNQTAGLFLRWYRDTLGKYLVATEPDRNPYEVLTAKATKKPSSLFVLPHLVGSGTPWIDPLSKAAFVGITLATTEGEIIRAIMEGVVLEQKINVDLFEKQGITFEEIRVTGGCARSRLWLQIRADVFGKPIKTLQCDDASVLGAAILAACGEGLYSSPKEASETMVRVKDVWEPKGENHEFYKERVALYRGLYLALRDIYHNMK